MKNDTVRPLNRFEMARARLQFYGRHVIETMWEQMVRNGWAARLDAVDARQAELQRRIDLRNPAGKQSIALQRRPPAEDRRRAPLMGTTRSVQQRSRRVQSRSNDSQRSASRVDEIVREIVASYQPAIEEAVRDQIRRSAQSGVRVPRTPDRSFYGRNRPLAQKSGERHFDESKHPRAPAGRADGGQFIDADGRMNPGTNQRGDVLGENTNPIGRHGFTPLRPSGIHPGYLITRNGTLIDPATKMPVALAGIHDLLGTAGPANLQFLAALLGLTPDYRAEFLNTLSEDAQEYFHSDWKVHHRFQQANIAELQEFFQKHMPKHDVHGIDNLLGVPNKVHYELNNLQGQFWEDEFDKLLQKDPKLSGHRGNGSKITAVLDNTTDKKSLFERYKKLVNHIESEYAPYIAKPKSTLTRLQSISTNMTRFADPSELAKRMIAHAQVMNPETYKQLLKRGAKKVTEDLIAVQKNGGNSGRFSKVFRHIGIGTLLMAVSSTARGATSPAAEQALAEFMTHYENLAEEERTKGYPQENRLQLLVDSFDKYLHAANVPEDTAAKIITLLRLKIGLNYDAGGG